MWWRMKFLFEFFPPLIDIYFKRNLEYIINLPIIRGGSSAGATGAWAPADIQQRVPGTRPEIFLGIKVSIYFQKYQDFK